MGLLILQFVLLLLLHARKLFHDELFVLLQIILDFIYLLWLRIMLGIYVHHFTKANLSRWVLKLNILSWNSIVLLVVPVLLLLHGLMIVVVLVNLVGWLHLLVMSHLLCLLLVSVLVRLTEL